MAACYQAPHRPNSTSDPLTYEHLQQYDNESSSQYQLAESSTYIFPNPSSVPPSPSHFSEVSERTEFSLLFSELGSGLGSPFEEDEKEEDDLSPRVLSISRIRVPPTFAKPPPPSLSSSSSSSTPNENDASWDLEFPLAPTLAYPLDSYSESSSSAVNRDWEVANMQGDREWRGKDDSITSVSVVDHLGVRSSRVPKTPKPSSNSYPLDLRARIPEAGFSCSTRRIIRLPLLSLLSSLLWIDGDTLDLITIPSSSSSGSVLFPGRKSVLLDDVATPDVIDCIWDDSREAAHGPAKLFEAAGAEDKARMIREGLRTLEGVPSLRLGLSGLWNFVAGIVTKWQ